MTSTEMVEQAIESMKKASEMLSKATSQTGWQALSEAKGLDAGFLSLLEALVSAQEATEEHFKKFAHENDVVWEKRSMECRQDWSRVCDRKRSVENNLLQYARSVVRAKNAA